MLKSKNLYYNGDRKYTLVMLKKQLNLNTETRLLLLHQKTIPSSCVKHSLDDSKVTALKGAKNL
jgi:hypothetical protein